MFDGKAFGQEVVSIVKAHMERTLAPVVARMDAIEAKLGAVLGKEDLDAIKSEVETVKQAIADLPKPEPISIPDIPALISEEVEKAVSAIERPKDGHSPTPEEYGPLISEAVQKAVAGLPVAKDGVSLAGMLIDRSGNLVATLSDGTTRDLGPVVGKDAEKLDTSAVERQVKELFDAWPKPKDGVDGLGFDDLEAVYDGERGVTLRMVRGERIKEFTFTMPVVIDRGVWKEQNYQPGDGVTWGGSFWIAQEPTAEKPDSGKGWRLAVKKGRDGKDGVLKEQRETKVKVAL